MKWIYRYGKKLCQKNWRQCTKLWSY